MHTLPQGQECQAWDLGRDPAGGTLRTRAGARGPALTGASGREVRVSNPKFKRWPQVSGQYEDIYQIHWGGAQASVHSSRNTHRYNTETDA